MRVMFVTSGLETGGAESTLLRLLPAMREFGVQSSVVSLRSVGTTGAMLRSRTISVLALGMPAPSSVVFGLRRLTREVHAWRPALVHGWMYHGNLAASAIAAWADLPVVWGIRQSLGSGSRDKWLTRRIIEVGSLLSKTTARIIYNSNAARVQHEAFGYASGRGAVMLNGFDTEEFWPDSVRAESARGQLGIRPWVPVVGLVARFHPTKDHATFLRAAARVQKKFPSAMFVLVGQGVDTANAELCSLIKALGITDSVRLLGRRDDVPQLIPMFDVACLTSTAESFPNAVGEAMCCGVPCVSTAVGDVAELIGDCGEVVPSADDAAVAAAIERLLAVEPAQRQALGRRARQRIVERFSITEVARRYAGLLQSVVGMRD